MPKEKADHVPLSQLMREGKTPGIKRIGHQLLATKESENGTSIVGACGLGHAMLGLAKRKGLTDPNGTFFALPKETVKAIRRLERSLPDPAYLDGRSTRGYVVRMNDYECLSIERQAKRLEKKGY